jgi:KDO2-lipid IV(A) lauroyltransferase
MVSRQEGLKPVIKAMKQGLPFYYLPDMDFGARDAEFVPFFGVRAATVTALPRLARLTGAIVIPVITRQLPGGQGYVTHLYPAWENFPSSDGYTDTLRMNQFIEARAKEMPEQYFWLHKRFKTRPPGERSFYQR